MASWKMDLDWRCIPYALLKMEISQPAMLVDPGVYIQKKTGSNSSKEGIHMSPYNPPSLA